MSTFIPSRFAGVGVIVTGAGSGIGKATAVRLLDEGATVVAVDISSERLAQLPQTYGRQLVPVTADVATEFGIDLVMAAAGGKIDALVNNAGIMDGFLAPSEVDDATWDRVFAVNVKAPMRLTRAVLPMMIAAGAGSIVNVASEGGLRGSCAGVAYTSSKHALIGYTRSTAVFHRGQGIRCNAVAPGGVRTNVDGAFRSDLARQVLGPLLAATVPKLADPEQIAATILFLLSDDASYINGAVVACDSGWSAV
ncbi:MAG: SDR family NAD(P)-dependent oxidoreductase [Actinomycetes bacterium]